jgi:hypothetical protein
VVHLDSLKDKRLHAPFDELRLGAGQPWPIAQIIPIRATNTDIACRCRRALLPARRPLAEIFFQRKIGFRAELCAPGPINGKRLRIFAQETWRFGY